MYKIINKSIMYPLVIAGLFLLSCNRENDAVTRASATAGETNTPTVEVVNPEKQDFTGVSELTGTLRPNQRVTLYAMESGFVRSIRKDIGDRVKEGELIARLKNPELERKLQREEAQFNVKNSIYERLQSIYDKTPDLTTLEQVEVAQAEYESARAMLEATRQQLDFLQLKAPFNGIVSERYVDKGALVQSGLTQANSQPIVELVETEKLRLNIYVPESDMAAVKEGSKIRILFPELPGESFEAEISRASGVLDPQTKTMRIEVDISNREQKLRPGMYARVEMQISSRPDVLSVPHPALSVEKNQYFIYRVVNDQVEKLPVRLGVQDKNYVEVLNAELKPDDQVVVSGKQLISPGMQVEAIHKGQKQQ